MGSNDSVHRAEHHEEPSSWGHLLAYDGAADLRTLPVEGGYVESHASLEYRGHVRSHGSHGCFGRNAHGGHAQPLEQAGLPDADRRELATPKVNEFEAHNLGEGRHYVVLTTTRKRSRSGRRTVPGSLPILS